MEAVRVIETAVWALALQLLESAPAIIILQLPLRALKAVIPDTDRWRTAHRHNTAQHGTDSDAPEGTGLEPLSPPLHEGQGALQGLHVHAIVT
jgi:hypothetical protein